MSPKPFASIIIPSLNEGINLRETVDVVRQTAGFPHEILVIDDGSVDRSIDFLEEYPRAYRDVRVIHTSRVGPARARNAGARVARGETLIFLDAHCVPQLGALRALREAVQSDWRSFYTACISARGAPNRRGWGATLTSPQFEVRWLPRPREPIHEIPVAGAACLATSGKTFFDVGGFAGFRASTLEDVELCIRSWCYGTPVRVVSNAEVAHLFRQKAWPPVRLKEYLRDALITAVLHLDHRKLARCIDAFRQWNGFDGVWAYLHAEEVQSARQKIAKRRVRDFDAYCERFRIDWYKEGRLSS